MKKQMHEGGVTPEAYCELVFRKVQGPGYEVVKDRYGLVGSRGHRVDSIEKYVNSDRRVGVISKVQPEGALRTEREQRHYNFSSSRLSF